MSQTHFRKAFNTPYLAAVDVIEPLTLTIARVALEPDQSKKSKEHFNTAYWEQAEIRPGEKLKPMILNATNCKFLAGLTGTPIIEEWAGAQVTVYVERGIKFGRDTVDGLRLSAPVGTLSATQIAEIEQLASVNGVGLMQITKAYGVDALIEVPANKFASIVRRLKVSKP